MITVYCDAETAGVIQSEIDRQYLGGEMRVQRHPWIPSGMVATIKDGRPWLDSADLVLSSIGGLRVLMSAAQCSGGIAGTEVADMKGI